MEGREIVGRLCDTPLRDDSDLDQMGAVVMERSRWIQDRFFWRLWKTVSLFGKFSLLPLLEEVSSSLH